MPTVLSDRILKLKGRTLGIKESEQLDSFRELIAYFRSTLDAVFLDAGYLETCFETSKNPETVKKIDQFLKSRMRVLYNITEKSL
jgi:hypothetical protein